MTLVRSLLILLALNVIASAGQAPVLDADAFRSDIATFNTKPWRFSIQQFMRSKQRRDDSVENFFSTELEVKLPWRIHLGRYRKGDSSGSLGNITFELHYSLANFGNQYANDEAFIEMRYSFAGQGKLALNPQLYLRYILVEHDSPEIEAKLRFTEKFPGGWRVSSSFGLDHQLRGPGSTEFSASGRLSKNILDGLFSIGCEAKFSHETVHGYRGDPEQKCYIGPSLRWRATKNLAVSSSWLIGTNDQANSSEIFLVVKYDFGGPDDQDFAAPVSDPRN